MKQPFCLDCDYHSLNRNFYLKKQMMKIKFLAISFLIWEVVIATSCSKSKADIQTQNSSDGPTEPSYGLTLNAGEDRIVLTQVVQLEGAQEVPAVSTLTKGIAILRVSESKKLYSKIIVQKLADGDGLRFAHIHAGAAGVNGPVRIGIADNAADFGVNKEFQLTNEQFELITSGAAYVNAHSNFFPRGIVRGQIR